MKAKVTVVTGAASGIGRALALELARRGARLAISDVATDGLDDTAARLRERGADVHAAPLDVRDRDAVHRYARAVADHFGVVHQLYNNAGIAGAVSPFVDVDLAAFERVLAVNLWGVIHGSQAFLPHLIASGDGHLINISSLNGYLAQPGMAAYCTSKFAVRGFTESVRADMALAGHPVQVTVVHPGGVATNIATAAAAVAAREQPALAAEGARRAAIYNQKLLTLPAERAAQIIVDGVEAGRPRVLVGRDAKTLDATVRLLPTAYTKLAVWLERRLSRDA
ncbi:MAG TPA: SDR family oxidoreductase [Kofleriaceae bacterium]|nr:SDR family oxidoreductase [Kofleriaceae bacterium]